MAAKSNRPEEDAAVKKKSSKSLLIIVLGLLVLAAGGAFAYKHFAGATGSRHSATADAGKESKRAELRKVTLDSFVVNLADPGMRRYLRAKITLEFTSPLLEEELNQKMHRIRDAIIAVLRAKTTDQLGQEDALKRELLSAVNSQLDNGRILALYFEEFIVQ